VTIVTLIELPLVLPPAVAGIGLLAVAGVGNGIAVNRDGAVHEGTHADRPELEWIRSHTNPEAREGDMRTLLTGADAVVGLTRPGVIGTDDVKQMANDPIVMALAMLGVVGLAAFAR